MQELQLYFVEKLTNIDYLTHLTCLKIESRRGIKCINKLINLKRLRLFSKDITNISNLINLISLAIDQHELDLDNLIKLTRLEFIHVAMCNFPNVINLKNLKMLYINGSKYIDFNHHTNLERLTIYNSIQTYNISSLVNLTYLDLKRSKNIHGIEYLTNLSQNELNLSWLLDN